MRTNSPSVQNVRGNDMPGPHRLDEILKTFLVMRWYVNDALHETSDVPEPAAEGLKKVLRELDVSIAAMTPVVEKRGLAPQERRDA